MEAVRFFSCPLSGYDTASGHNPHTTVVVFWAGNQSSTEPRSSSLGRQASKHSHFPPSLSVSLSPPAPCLQAWAPSSSSGWAIALDPHLVPGHFTSLLSPALHASATHCPKIQADCVALPEICLGSVVWCRSESGEDAGPSRPVPSVPLLLISRCHHPSHTILCRYTHTWAPSLPFIPATLIQSALPLLGTSGGWRCYTDEHTGGLPSELTDYLWDADDHQVVLYML